MSEINLPEDIEVIQGGKIEELMFNTSFHRIIKKEKVAFILENGQQLKWSILRSWGENHSPKKIYIMNEEGAENTSVNISCNGITGIWIIWIDEVVLSTIAPVRITDCKKVLTQCSEGPITVRNCNTVRHEWIVDWARIINTRCKEVHNNGWASSNHKRAHMISRVTNEKCGAIVNSNFLWCVENIDSRFVWNTGVIWSITNRWVDTIRNSLWVRKDNPIFSHLQASEKTHFKLWLE